MFGAGSEPATAEETFEILQNINEERKQKEAGQTAQKTEQAASSTRRKKSFKEQKEFEELEKKIEELEGKKSELETLMADSDYTVAQKAGEDYRLVEDHLEKSYARWEELAELD